MIEPPNHAPGDAARQADSSDSGRVFGDPRLFAPAAERNRQPILDVLSRVLPISGLVL